MDSVCSLTDNQLFLKTSPDLTNPNFKPTGTFTSMYNSK